MQTAGVTLPTLDEIQVYAADIYNRFRDLGPLDQGLQSLFKACRKFSQVLVRERFALTEHIAQLETHLQELEEAAKQQPEQAAAFAATVGERDSLRHQLATLSAELDSAQHQLKDLDDKYQTNQTLLAAATQKLSEVNAVLAKREARIADIESGSLNMSAERVERQRLAVELSDARVAYHIVAEEAAKMKLAMDAQRAEVGQALNRANESQTRIQELERQIAALRAENQQLTEKLVKTTQLNQELQHAMESLRQSAAHLEVAPVVARTSPEAVNTLKLMLKRRATRLAELGRELAGAQAKLRVAQAEAAGYRGKVMMTERRAKEAQETLQALEQTVNSVAARLMPLLSPAKRIMFEGIHDWEAPIFNMFSMELMDDTIERGSASKAEKPAAEQDVVHDNVVSLHG